MKLWNVQFTSYEDGYKHRYDSGVYQEESEVFYSESDATNCLIERLCNELMQIFQDRNIELNEVPKQLQKYVEKDKYGKLVMKSTSKNILVLRLFQDEFLSGEFVDSIFDFNIYFSNK